MSAGMAASMRLTDAVDLDKLRAEISRILKSRHVKLIA